MTEPITAEVIADLDARYSYGREHGCPDLSGRPRNIHEAAGKPFTRPVMAVAAYLGIARDVVRTISPHSEADEVALLLQFLTMAGNAIGREPYYQVESDKHHSNLNCVLVGASSKARKGTSMGRSRAVLRVADEPWADNRIKGGLSSGEGLINEVRDAVEKYDSKEKRLEVVDAGVSDKRLMIVEPEFAGLLSVADRHGNTISPLIRRAWDGDKLQTITKNSPLSATGAHISIIGHITEDELRARITAPTWLMGLRIGFCSPALNDQRCFHSVATCPTRKSNVWVADLQRPCRRFGRLVVFL